MSQEANPSAVKKRKRYIVRCMDQNCKGDGRYNSYPWQAILDWNKSPSSDFPAFLELPFQRFNGMTYAEIQDVLKSHSVSKKIKARR